MDKCMIDCMIRGHLINLLYIMIKNMILTHDQKQKSLPYDQSFNLCF